MLTDVDMLGRHGDDAADTEDNDEHGGEILDTNAAIPAIYTQYCHLVTLLCLLALLQRPPSSSCYHRKQVLHN